MSISNPELTIDDELQHEHSDEPTLDAESAGGAEATARAEPAVTPVERERKQALDNLPRDRDPRHGYIELGSEDEPGANAETNRGNQAPASADPAVTSGEHGCRQTIDGATGADERRLAPGKSRTVSQRKLNANRKNAKKSTGPRTARGKAYSRKNAIKHGLFTRNMFEILMLGESQAEYDLLLDDLHKEYEPIGRAKELEVERIADCWWRLQRARRYEESVIRNSCIRGAKELAQFERDCKARDQEREATIRGLENMVAELSVAREVPPDLKQRFFALTSLNEQHWQRFDEMGEEWLKAKASRDPELAGILPTREGSPGRASRTLQAAIDWYEVQSQSATPIGMKMAFGHYVIPDRDDLDKLLRYETTIERSLDRALNRLERLQKMRPRKRRDSKAAAEGAETTADASSPES